MSGNHQKLRENGAENSVRTMYRYNIANYLNDLPNAIRENDTVKEIVNFHTIVSNVYAMCPVCLKISL